MVQSSVNMFFLILLLSAFFILIGSGIISSGLRKILSGCQARAWASTIGKVVSIKSEDTSDAEGNSRELIVRYSYSDSSRDYLGGTIHPAYGISSFERVNRYLETALRPGDQVRVYYDETTPSRSTLSVGFYPCSLALVSMGFTSCALGIGVLLIFGFGFDASPLLFFGAVAGLFLLSGWFFVFADGDFTRGIKVVANQPDSNPELR